jgi:hypothetical protein
VRVADAERTPQPPGALSLAVNQLNEFLRSNESQPTDITNAVAQQLAGAVEYFTGGDQVEPLMKSADDFERARKLIPYDPNAITLAVAAQVAAEWRLNGRCEQTALKAQRLSAAGALGSDKGTLANLNSLYALLLSGPEPAPGADNLSIEVVKERVASLSGVTIPQ